MNPYLLEKLIFAHSKCAILRLPVKGWKERKGKEGREESLDCPQNITLIIFWTYFKRILFSLKIELFGGRQGWWNIYFIVLRTDSKHNWQCCCSELSTWVKRHCFSLSWPVWTGFCRLSVGWDPDTLLLIKILPFWTTQDISERAGLPCRFIEGSEPQLPSDNQRFLTETCNLGQITTLCRFIVV